MSFDNKLNKCTYDTTKDTFQPQYWKRCYKCWPQEDKGACLECIAICHDGHTVDVNVRYGNFYCDCGSDHTNCKLKNRMSVSFPPVVDSDTFFPRSGGSAIPRPPAPSPYPHPLPGQPQIPRFDPSRFPQPPTPPGQYGQERFPVTMCSDGLYSLHQNSTQKIAHPTPTKSKSPDLPMSESPPGTF